MYPEVHNGLFTIRISIPILIRTVSQVATL